jgi:hypothetical protein
MTTDKGSSPLVIAQQLAAVAKADTVYGDLYRRRARARLAAILSPADYGRLKQSEPEIARVLKESAAAVEKGDWSRVQTLAANASRLQQELNAKKSEMAFAGELYDYAQPSLDPFSPGLRRPGAIDPAATLAQLRAGLEQLLAADPEWADFYVGRRAYFGKLMLASQASTKRGAAPTVTDPAEARREAMRALEHGELARLQKLAESLSTRSVEEKGAAEEKRSAEGSVDLAVPFDANVVAKAKSLGLEAVTLSEVPHGAELIRRHALTAAFSGPEVTREGATRAQAVYEDPDLKDYPATARELVSLFAINLYVNSGGARYLPRLVAETVFVEGFPETDDPPIDSPLLKALGLARRKAVSRVAIETALEERGLAVLEQDLGLDPRVYKLVCIPCDVYVVAGGERDWGKGEVWTHFDGYQVIGNGQLRALVGGDVRYGGRHDLVSIARDDERDKVITRFAVVRRERMVVR